MQNGKLMFLTGSWQINQEKQNQKKGCMYSGSWRMVTGSVLRPGSRNRHFVADGGISEKMIIGQDSRSNRIDWVLDGNLDIGRNLGHARQVGDNH